MHAHGMKQPCTETRNKAGEATPIACTPRGTVVTYPDLFHYRIMYNATSTLCDNAYVNRSGYETTLDNRMCHFLKTLQVNHCDREKVGGDGVEMKIPYKIERN